MTNDKIVMENNASDQNVEVELEVVQLEANSGIEEENASEDDSDVLDPSMKTTSVDLENPDATEKTVGMEEGSNEEEEQEEEEELSPFGSSETSSSMATAPPIEQLEDQPWHEHPRIKELYKKADWWTLWIGLLSFDLAVILVFAVPLDGADADRAKYVVPQPKEWSSNPLDAWTPYNLIGIPVLLLVFLAMYVLALKAMGKLMTKHETEDGETITKAHGNMFDYIKGFFIMATLATVAFWLGRNEWCSDHGLGYAVFAILLGMIPANLVPAERTEKLRKFTAKDGEFFIKCSLGLLAVELSVIAKVGGPAMIVTWIGSPLAIVIGFSLGTRLLGCPDTLAMLIAVGASWCGASAISAVAPVVMASSEDVALAISVVAFFTVIFTFVQPYVAMAVGMPDDVAGAWIGGSVDQTGNVIVSAAIISEEATETAGIVKMVLNAGMGVMVSVIACYWSVVRTSDQDGKATPFSLFMLWDKFPKFTLGFIITSIAMTLIVQELNGSIQAEALPTAVSTLNKWWFAIAFCGIGLTTNIRKLFQEAWKSGVIQVYLLANSVDVFLALGLAYLAYQFVG